MILCLGATNLMLLLGPLRSVQLIMRKLSTQVLGREKLVVESPSSAKKARLYYKTRNMGSLLRLLPSNDIAFLQR